MGFGQPSEFIDRGQCRVTRTNDDGVLTRVSIGLGKVRDLVVDQLRRGALTQGREAVSTGGVGLGPGPGGVDDRTRVQPGLDTLGSH
jgi:hypothetical protein